MERLAQAAILTKLIQRLRHYGSWCGETHIQKAVFFLQEITDVPLEFKFVLYWHGPFSFDLRDELTGLRADGLLRLKPVQGYGPKITPTDRCEYIQEWFPEVLELYDKHLEFIAVRIGNAGAVELERLATACFVTRFKLRSGSVSKRSRKLHQLKPHIPLESAREAVIQSDKITADWRENHS